MAHANKLQHHYKKKAPSNEVDTITLRPTSQEIKIGTSEHFFSIDTHWIILALALNATMI